MQTSEQKSMAQSRGTSFLTLFIVTIKENPKQEGEGVVILMDEEREFESSSEVSYQISFTNL